MSDGKEKQTDLATLQKRVGDLELRIAELSDKIASLLKSQSPGPVQTKAKSPVVVETKADAAEESLKDDHGRLLAVITAAAMAVLGRRIVVRKITFINQNTVSGWAEAGRQSIHYSHNIRR